MNFDAALDELTRHMQRLRGLDLAAEADRRLALEESLVVLCALARYRGLIKNIAELRATEALGPFSPA